MHLSEIKSLRSGALVELAESLQIENAAQMRRSKLIQHLARRKAESGETLLASGSLELMSDGFGFLRDERSNFQASDDDIYLPPALARRGFLRTGDFVEVEFKLPTKENEKYMTATRVISVNGQDPQARKGAAAFEELTPLHPNRHLKLERPIRAEENITGRLIDLIAPIGFGQRALLVAPPKSGKTVMMQHIAHAISANHPDAHLIVLLIDERPEEVTEMERSVAGQVFASTFDEPPDRHVQLAEMVIEKAKRLAESKKDVIILLDSITRLARAYNTVMPSSGKILSGGVEANALQRPKRFFGAARNLEEGGSLTIIATALVDTGSRMDEVIYEEFKGTGNMEIHLDRRLMEKRVYPAVNINRSGTRREELLLPPDVLSLSWILRKALHSKEDMEATEFLISKLRESKNNAEFFENMRKK